MNTRVPFVSIRLHAHHAESLFYELLGLIDHYRTSNTTMDDTEERALLSAIAQLERGLHMSKAAADHELDQLRHVVPLTA
jgi:hypothetical protein